MRLLDAQQLQQQPQWQVNPYTTEPNSLHQYGKEAPNTISTRIIEDEWVE
jgi:hypothetical protein